MQKHTINMIILTVIAVIILIVAIKFSTQKQPIKNNEECVELTLFRYDSCYDFLTNKILLKIESIDNYKIKDLRVIFNDSTQKEVKIPELPLQNQTKNYVFGVLKNPEKLELNFYIENAPAEFCNNLTIPVRLRTCSQQEASNLTVSIIGENIGNITGANVTNITNIPREENPSDILSPELFQEAELFETKCKSAWLCNEWEGCYQGVQKRDCYDKNVCLIPTDIPQFTRSCSSICIENWQCEWSRCENGYTTAICKDLSSCNTEYNKPTKLACINPKTECIPNIACTIWSDCSIEYNFESVVKNINELHGTKLRLCIDRNSCINPVYEEKNCSTRVDIYTRLCKNGYLEIHDKLTDRVIAKVRYIENLDVNLYLAEENLSTC